MPSQEFGCRTIRLSISPKTLDVSPLVVVLHLFLDELVNKILAAATSAASGGNSQRWRFLVIKDHTFYEGKRPHAVPLEFKYMLGRVKWMPGHSTKHRLDSCGEFTVGHVHRILNHDCVRRKMLY